MRIIPVLDTYAQTFNVVFANQSCKINLYQKSTGLFLDLYINDVLIRGGVKCENNNRMIRDAYLGFVGDLTFTDIQGGSDPSSPGLNSRYFLCYLEAGD